MLRIYLPLRPVTEATGKCATQVGGDSSFDEYPRCLGSSATDRGGCPPPLRLLISINLPCLRSSPLSRGINTTMRALTSSRFLSRGLDLPASSPATSPPFRRQPPHAVCTSLSHATPQRVQHPLSGLDFACALASSSQHMAESRSLSYGPGAPFPLLSTMPFGIAVTFRFGPESVCPVRYCPSLSLAPRRRTRAGCHPGRLSSLTSRR